MTDLKNLLDRAAGAEPGVTDTDLSADLRRGRRALHIRRVTGMAAGAIATAVVAGVGWLVLPNGSALDGAPDVATRPSTTPSPVSPHIPGGSTKDNRGLPPVPSEPVQLVPNPTPFPGRITCDLVPKGWTARITYPAATSTDWEQQELTDPNLRNPAQYHDVTHTVGIRQSELLDNGQGITADKYTKPWTQLPKVRAGQNEAVVSGPLGGGGNANGRREVHVRQGNGTRVIVVANHAYNLAWDLPTVLKFAGSCHYKK